MNQRDQFDELLGAYFDGELVNDEQSRARSLLAESADNQRVVDELEMLHGSIQEFPRERLDADFRHKVISAIEQRRSQQSQTHIVTARRLLIAISSLAVALLVMWAVISRLSDTDKDPLTDSGKSSPKARLVPGSDNQGSNNKLVQPKQDQALAGTTKRQMKKKTDTRPDTKDVTPLVKNDQKLNKGTVEKKGLEKGKKKGPALALAKRYLFTIELVITEEGFRSRAFDTVLQAENILYQPSLKVDRGLEDRLLKSRLLKGVVGQKRKQDQVDEVQLVYVIADSDRVDPMWNRLRSIPGEISEMKFNMAITTDELKIFEQLKQRESVNYAQLLKKKKQEADAKIYRARKLILNLALMSKLTRTMAVTGKVGAPPLAKKGPFVPVKPAKPQARAPHDVGGRKRDAQILFIIHRGPTKKK